MPYSSSFDQAAAEGVGLENIGAGFEELGVDVLDDRGIDDRQIVVAAFLAAVILDGQLHIENGGAHRPVVEDDAVADDFAELSHGRARSRGT